MLKFTTGFTLIELLVVISIIGLLSSIVFASLSGARSRARDLNRKANLKQLVNALELYYSDNASYPTTASTLWGESPAWGSHTLSGANGWIPNLAPQYISRLPHDPLTGTNNFADNPGCDTTMTNYLYISDGVDYKILAHCLVETLPVLTIDSFYDPVRPTWALQVSSVGAAAKGW